MPAVKLNLVWRLASQLTVTKLWSHLVLCSDHHVKGLVDEPPAWSHEPPRVLEHNCTTSWIAPKEVNAHPAVEWPLEDRRVVYMYLPWEWIKPNSQRAGGRT